MGCNDLQANALGYASSDEVIGKSLFDLFHPADAQKLSQTNSDIMRKGTTVIIEEKAKRHDGSIGNYISHKTPLFDDKHVVIGLLGISFDITGF